MPTLPSTGISQNSRLGLSRLEVGPFEIGVRIGGRVGQQHSLMLQLLQFGQQVVFGRGCRAVGIGLCRRVTYHGPAVIIPSATSSTFTLTQAEVGKAITVTATYTDLQGTPETVTSDATLNVVNGNDPVSGSVVITGQARQGKILSAAASVSDPDGLPESDFDYQYQWFAGWAAIEGGHIVNAAAFTGPRGIRDLGACIVCRPRWIARIVGQRSHDVRCFGGDCRSGPKLEWCRGDRWRNCGRP